MRSGTTLFQSKQNEILVYKQLSFPNIWKSADNSQNFNVSLLRDFIFLRLMETYDKTYFYVLFYISSSHRHGERCENVTQGW